MPEASEKCQNCGRVIGKLEKPYLWQEHVVCSQCRKTLEADSAQAPGPEAGDETAQALDGLQTIAQAAVGRRAATPAPATKRRTLPGEKICPNPNCGYCGKPERVQHGSYLLAMGLIFGVPIFMFVLYPGLLRSLAFGVVDPCLLLPLVFCVLGFAYLVFGVRKTVVCPRCKIKIEA